MRPLRLPPRLTTIACPHSRLSMRFASRHIESVFGQARYFSCTTTKMAATTSMQKANRLRAAFVENKGPSYGIWQMYPNTNVSRALARANPDWIMVDCEHGNIDDAAMHEAIPAIAACGVSPLVRLPDTQAWMIKREWAQDHPVVVFIVVACCKRELKLTLLVRLRSAGCWCTWGEIETPWLLTLVWC